MNTPDTPGTTTPPAPQKRGPGRPRTRPPKRKLTPEELSRIRAEAGRKGGRAGHKGQRPRRTSIFVYATDKARFVEFALSNGKTLLDGMTLVADRLTKPHTAEGHDETAVLMQPDDYAVVKRVMSARGLSAPLALHLIVEFFSKRVEF